MRPENAAILLSARRWVGRSVGRSLGRHTVLVSEAAGAVVYDIAVITCNHH